MVKNLPAITGGVRDYRSDPWVGKIPWSRAWQPTPIFLPGESHGQRSLAGHSPWGHEESAQHTHQIVCAVRDHVYHTGKSVPHLL